MASNGNLNFTNVNKVTFEGVGSAPNAVIDTTTGKIGVGVDNPDANLHVVGNSYVSTNLELGGTLIMGTVNVEARHALSAITATGNITPHTVEFTNPTTGLVTTGNVSVGGELIVSSNLTVTGGDVNMLHTSNTASLKLNSNVVTEFPRSKKLIKYPRVALTGYSQDGYVVSSTTNYYDSGNPLYPWQVFNDSGHRYQSIRDDYSSSTGNYTGTVNQTTVDGSLIGGDWVQLELPNKISLNRFTVALNMGSHGGRMGRSYVLTGSNNGSTWTTVSTHTQSYGNGADGNHVNHNVNSTTTYKYYRLIATSTFHNTQANGGPWALGKWELYGIPEYDPEADGVDVVVKSLPNVPNTDWLEVYYDGQDYTSMPATVTDKSGNNLTGTPSGGVGFDTGYKAFTFDGSNDFISTTSTATLSNHTASMWIKFDSPAAWEAVYTIKPASGFDRNNFILYLNSTYFRLESSGNTGPYYDLAYNFVIGAWVHLTLVFKSSGLEDCELYIDNVRLVPTGSKRSETDDITITGTNTIYVGSDPAGYYLDGSIANFRLFNRALSSDEIYQLYAYQKEYFGHGVLGMTLKAGRLGIGTTEPRAALDVRGDIRTSGLVNNAGMHWRISDASGGNVIYTLNGGNWFSSTASSTIYGTVLSTENNAPISAWDPVSGYFTAPEDGLYLIDLGLFINGLDSGRWGNFQLLHTDGTTKEGQYTFYTIDLTVDDTVGYSKTVYMKTGEKFSFYTGAGEVTLYLSGGPPGHTTMNVYKIS